MVATLRELNKSFCPIMEKEIVRPNPLLEKMSCKLNLPANALELAMRDVVKKRNPGRREINAGLSILASLKLDLEAKVRSL